MGFPREIAYGARHLRPPGDAMRCQVCGREFQSAMVTVDAGIAARYCAAIAKLERDGAAILVSHSAIYRIGGRVGSRFRKAETGNALAYCRAVSLNFAQPVCVVADDPTAQVRPVALEAPESTSSFRIVDPDHGSTVRPMHSVSGVIDGEREAFEAREVWVVVRPERGLFWVQRPALVSHGRWKSVAHFGDRSTEDGHAFAVYALLDPVADLVVGETLSKIPAARRSAGPVSVTLERLAGTS